MPLSTSFIIYIYSSANNVHYLFLFCHPHPFTLQKKKEKRKISTQQWNPAKCHLRVYRHMHQIHPKYFSPLASSFSLCTITFNASFSSSSDSRKAFRSIAKLSLASKSSKDVTVALENDNKFRISPTCFEINDLKK